MLWVHLVIYSFTNVQWIVKAYKQLHRHLTFQNDSKCSCCYKFFQTSMSETRKDNVGYNE